MKLKFGDPESIHFVKKALAQEWLFKHMDDVLVEFDEFCEMPQCDSDKFSASVKQASDSYFWFVVDCEEHNWFEYGTIFKWKTKKWYFELGHQLPKSKQNKDQISFA